MAKQEITLKGLDGHEDHLVYNSANGQVSNSLEECARSLFPQEGETTPRLRFQGFEGEWVSTKLCEISRKVTTKNTDLKYKTTLTNSAEFGIINQLDFFDHDISNGDNIRGYFVVEPDDFVYNPRISVTAPVGPINRNQLGYAGVMSPLYYVFRVEGIDLDYLSYYFKTKLWHKFMYDNGNSGARFDRFSISDEVFGQMPILHPTDIEEQKAIAAFFHRLDSQIALRKNQYERLLQVKSACLESMFPRGTEIAPPIRFNGFEEEWVVVPLSDCLMVNKERNINGMYTKNDVLSVSDDFGVVNQIELLGRSFAGKSVANYRVLKHGEIVYTKSPLKIKPFGIIKVNEGKDGIVSTLYAVYTAKEGVSPQFINYYFAPSHRMNSYIHPLVNKGAKNDMKVSDENVLKGNICIPSSLDEQKCIASFFEKLDSHISTEQQRLERLKQMKSACLRSMFPQNGGGGGNLPLIRFNGYVNDWTLMKFSDMAQRVSTYDLSNDLPCVEFEDIIAGEGVLNKDIYMKSVKKRGIQFKENDVLFGKLRPYLKNILLADFQGIAVGDFWVLRNTESVDPYFLYVLVSSEGFMKVANISSGSKMPRADWNLVSNSVFSVPPSIEEQRQIASFFRSLDKKILLQTQHIEKLKQMKTACLDKMIA